MGNIHLCLLYYLLFQKILAKKTRFDEFVVQRTRRRRMINAKCSMQNAKWNSAMVILHFVLLP